MQLPCPNCGQLLEAPEPLPARAQCPYCQAVFQPGARDETLRPPPAPYQGGAVVAGPQVAQPDQPYRPPAAPYQPAVAPPHVVAADAVRAPAICLIVVGALGLLWAGFDLFGRVILVTQVRQGQPPPLPPFLPPDLARQIAQQQQDPASVALGFGLDLILFVANILITVGAIKMLRLRSYAWAMTSSILAVVPCLSCCCITGIPFGIWSLVVLNRSDVRPGFP